MVDKSARGNSSGSQLASMEPEGNRSTSKTGREPFFCVMKVGMGRSVWECLKED